MKLVYASLMATTALKPLAFDDGPPKAFYAGEEEIPATLKPFYAQVGERWELKVEIPGVEGVKSFIDFERLNGALRKERNDHRALKTSFAPILAIGAVTEVIAQLDKIPELEAQIEAGGGTPSAAKIEELVVKRLDARVAPLKRELDTTKQKLTETEAVVGTFQNEKKVRTIQDAVRTAATKAKITPEAMDDAFAVAERVFEVSDDGKATVKDNVGFTPGLDPVSWMAEMAPRKPHWFGTSQGGGSGGGGSGGNGLNNPFTDANWNMTEQGRIYVANPTQAENLARAAGTTVGGPRPRPKK